MLTTSPSMDILVSSNLERLIYMAAGEDPQRTAALMEELKEDGRYSITEEMKERLSDFAAGYADEGQTAASIKKAYDSAGYVMDTHTAVASHVCGAYRKESGDQKECIIASTASPYKFVQSVMTALGLQGEQEDELSLLPKLQEASGVEMPQAVKEILEAKILHRTECDTDKMDEAVRAILGI